MFDGAGCLIVVEQRDGVVQVRQVVALQLQCLVVPGGRREAEMGDREKWSVRYLFWPPCEVKGSAAYTLTRSRVRTLSLSLSLSLLDVRAAGVAKVVQPG